MEKTKHPSLPAVRLLAAVLLLFGFTALHAAAVGRISFLLGAPGDVEIMDANGKAAVPAALKMEVKTGDTIKTKSESRCEITLTDGAILRIGENTTLQLTEASLKKKSQRVKADLSRGNIWVNLNQAAQGKRDFQIKAPTAVCAVRGTIYRIEADSTTTCIVYDGTVSVGPLALWGKSAPKSWRTGPPQPVPGPTQVAGPYEVSLEQWQQIVRGYQITVRGDGKFAKSRVNDKKEAGNEWVQWNKQRDANEN